MNFPRQLNIRKHEIDHQSVFTLGLVQVAPFVRWALLSLMYGLLLVCFRVELSVVMVLGYCTEALYVLSAVSSFSVPKSIVFILVLGHSFDVVELCVR